MIALLANMIACHQTTDTLNIYDNNRIYVKVRALTEYDFAPA